ncbi:MAG: MarR family winged helix-turn-helix transcriptional regulator [Desulfobulbaceae bacterium]|jgi:predicted transcriptional regulator|nr:MarR family winged helix-turn-helix transcriptional regulator [Desulfobulbaceae bacterium]
MAGCGCGCNKGLTDEQKKILAAMAGQTGPSGCKDIAAATGLESKSVSCKLTALKKKGYISSPVRCKYEITEEGRAAK